MRLGLLGWNRPRLAMESGTATHIVRYYEEFGRSMKPGHGQAGDERIAAIRGALEAAGIVFTNGDEPGVKLRKPEE